MKIAIFSDVHSNLPALKAVLTDIKKQRASMQFCLGDIVGYNAEPAECVQRVRETCDYVIQGNHDEACALDLDIADFSSIAQAGIKYSRAHLSAEHKQYLRDLPLLKTTDRWTYVHASLADPSEWYYVDSPREALLHFREQRTPVAFLWPHTSAARVAPRQKRRARHGTAACGRCAESACKIFVQCRVGATKPRSRSARLLHDL